MDGVCCVCEDTHHVVALSPSCRARATRLRCSTRARAALSRQSVSPTIPAPTILPSASLSLSSPHSPSPSLHRHSASLPVSSSVLSSPPRRRRLPARCRRSPSTLRSPPVTAPPSPGVVVVGLGWGGGGGSPPPLCRPLAQHMPPSAPRAPRRRSHRAARDVDAAPSPPALAAPAPSLRPCAPRVLRAVPSPTTSGRLRFFSTRPIVRTPGHSDQ